MTYVIQSLQTGKYFMGSTNIGFTSITEFSPDIKNASRYSNESRAILAKKKYDLNDCRIVKV